MPYGQGWIRANIWVLSRDPKSFSNQDLESPSPLLKHTSSVSVVDKKIAHQQICQRRMEQYNKKIVFFLILMKSSSDASQLEGWKPQTSPRICVPACASAYQFGPAAFPGPAFLKISVFLRHHCGLFCFQCPCTPGYDYTTLWRNIFISPQCH